MYVRALLTSALMVLACALGCSKRALEPDGAGTIGQDGGAGGEQDATAGGGSGGAGVPDAGQDPGALLGFGRRCSSADECASGFCAQGFCCDRACTDPCWSCDQEVTAGACLPRPAGAVCGAGACDGAAVVGQKICDDNGACGPGPAVICAPFACDPAAAACRWKCESDQDCVGTYCDFNSGRCHIATGVGCTRNTECVSGFCADGHCCNTACNGDCQSCDVGGHEGTCWPRPDLCPGAAAGGD
jgi:hypothetical protein